MRKIYLNTKSRQEALRLLIGNTQLDRKTERVGVGEALGRITAYPIIARTSQPNYPASAMDGVAVRSRETFGASDQRPLTLIKESYIEVDTGDPIPALYDAVIKIEDLHELGDGSLELLSPVAPGTNIRSVGEDVVAGDILIQGYHLLKPADLGVILAGGHQEVQVLTRPRVAVIPTGDELVAPGTLAQTGEIVEFNGTIICNYLRQWGAEPQLMQIIPDRPELLQDAVHSALDTSDLVIINAGSSAGREDYTAGVIQELGRVLVHGISARPGKPTVLGEVRGKPVLGLPGYPVACAFALEWFARPLIYQYLRQPEPTRPRLKVRLGRRVVSVMGSEEFIPVSVGQINGDYLANPLNRGAGVTMSLVRAHGLLVIPAEVLGYEEEEEVVVELYYPEETLRNSIMAVGSHDLALDLLASFLRKDYPELLFSSSHVGSMGGIQALAKRQAHMAGIHLFDAERGDYNVGYVTRYLADQDMILVNLAYRMQGWIVAPGNPLGIQTLADLVGGKVKFVNRQKGAGTRLLFDYLLSQSGCSREAVYGYEKEEYTHLNVAAAVAAGTAQVGLGILSAARAYGLDFIPVSEERYDLLMTREFFNSNWGQQILAVLQNPDFRKEIEELGGYSLRDAGQVVFERAE